MDAVTLSAAKADAKKKFAGRGRAALRGAPGIATMNTALSSTTPARAWSKHGSTPSALNYGSGTKSYFPIVYNDPRVSMRGIVPVLNSTSVSGVNFWANGCNGAWTPSYFRIEFDYYNSVANGAGASTMAAASSGATSIVLAQSYLAGTSLVLDPGLGAQEIVTTVGSPTGTGPYTHTVAALAQNHLANAVVTTGSLVVRYRAIASSGTQFWVWIDDQPVTAAPEAVPAGFTPTQLDTNYLRLVFPTVGRHRVKVYMYYAEYGGVDINYTDAISPVQSSAPTIAWFGDSYIEGAVPGVIQPTLFATQASRQLGFEPYVAGQGATGYAITPGTTGKAIYADATRLASLATTNADYVVVYGSLNDDGSTTSAVAANAATILSTLATSMPNSKVILVGPPKLQTTVSTIRSANNVALKAAALAAPNCLGYIDAITDNGIWGTGKTGSPVGDGPADTLLYSDGTHLTQAGNDFYGSYLAQGIRSLINVA